MNYIKFTISRGEPFSLPMEQAEQVLNSPNQLVMLKDKDGKWSGQTINKAHIICTDLDIEATDSERARTSIKLNEGKEAPQTPEERARVAKIKADIDSMLKRKKI